MFRPTPSSSALPLSHIIAPDAPLLSPAPSEALLEPAGAPASVVAAAAALFAADPTFTYEPYPPYAFDAHALKLRASPDQPPTPDEACVATSQLFGDLTPVDCGSPAPEDDGSESPRPSTPVSLDSPARAPVRKPHRVSTKDFIPPDVTGLSKREARLVKNRAAAFLSRQRKREEFELMEVRVAELEQENALLRGATHTLPAAAAPASAPAPSGGADTLLSEIEQLRAQLAAAERQTAALSAQLQHAAPVVKAEPMEVAMPSQAASPAPRSRSSSVTSQKPERSGASLGLMVLLCALPTLLSMPTQSALPARLTMPASALAHRPTHAPSHSLSAFDPLQFLPAESDFSNLMDMDMDLDSFGAEREMLFSLPAPAPAPASPAASLFGDEHDMGSGTRTLAFADGEKLGLGGLDISFDAVPAHDGKIRVRIHPNAAAGASSPAATLSRGASPFPAMPGAFSPEPDAHLGPWLGVADERPFDSRASFASSVDGFDSRASFGSLDGLDFGRASPAPAQRRRVRIALKSVPAPGGEGGEWEVELC